VKVEIRVNGRIGLELTPENEIEKLSLATMAAAHEKGKPVMINRIGTADDGAVMVSVER
jgi:hypothetical protein